MKTSEHPPADSINTLLSDLNERYGKPTLRTVREMAHQAAHPAFDPLPTGYAALDGLLGGGVACGKLTEFVGGLTSGVGSVGFGVLQQAQARGEVGILIDPHARFDPAHAVAHHIDLETLLVVRPPDAAVLSRIVCDIAAADLAGVMLIDARLTNRPLHDVSRMRAVLRQAAMALIVLSPPEPANVAPGADVRLAVEWVAWRREEERIIGWQARVTIMKGRQCAMVEIDLA